MPLNGINLYPVAFRAMGVFRGEGRFRFRQAGISVGLGPRRGSRRSSLLKATVRMSVQRLSGSNCSAIESTHPRNCPIRFSESLIELASACVEVRWIVRLPPFLRSVSSDLKTHFSKNALRYDGKVPPPNLYFQDIRSPHKENCRKPH